MNLIFIYICILSQEVMLFSQLSSSVFFLHYYAIEIIHFVSVQPLSINRILHFQLLVLLLWLYANQFKGTEFVSLSHFSFCQCRVFNTIKPFVNLPITSKNRERKRLQFTIRYIDVRYTYHYGN